MPAVSKKQQKFFGIVRSVQKGEQSPTTPEVAKAASSMKKGDVKKFASTKHKGLPVKKRQELKEWPKWDPSGAKAKRDALRNAGGGDHTIWKPSIDIPGNEKINITKGTWEGPIKDALKVGKGITKVGKWIGKNPRKTALIGAGVIGAGMLAKRALSRKKKKEVKEQTTFPQMQERIRNAKERRRDQKKQSEKLYMDTKKKGVKFYDKKGTGRLKDGKKVYD